MHNGVVPCCPCRARIHLDLVSLTCQLCRRNLVDALQFHPQAYLPMWLQWLFFLTFLEASLLQSAAGNETSQPDSFCKTCCARTWATCINYCQHPQTCKLKWLEFAWSAGVLHTAGGSCWNLYQLNTINQSWSNSLTAGPNITDCRASSFQLLGCSLIYQPCAIKQRNLMPYATLQVLAPC